MVLMPTSCKEEPQTPAQAETGEDVWGGPWPAVLLLGLVLGAAARLDCVGDTYPTAADAVGSASRGPTAGSGMVSHCDHSRDTVCHPCAPSFYNEAVNYDTCKQCTQCNRGSGSQLKQTCTPTWDTICHRRLGTQPRADSYKRGVDCAPCPPGHFSLGNTQACKPWTNLITPHHPAAPWLGSRHCGQPAPTWTRSEDRSPPATLPWETQGPTARPTTAQPTAAGPQTSQGPSTPPLEVPRGPALAALLGLGLGLLAPLAVVLALHLLRRAWRWPDAAGGNSFWTPIQEEQADTHSTLAKI